MNGTREETVRRDGGRLFHARYSWLLRTRQFSCGAMKRGQYLELMASELEWLDLCIHRLLSVCPQSIQRSSSFRHTSCCIHNGSGYEFCTDDDDNDNGMCPWNASFAYVRSVNWWRSMLARQMRRLTDAWNTNSRSTTSPLQLLMTWHNQACWTLPSVIFINCIHHRLHHLRRFMLYYSFSWLWKSNISN